MQIHNIESVLLADGWHLVRRGSFRVGEFVLVEKDDTVVGSTSALQHGAQWEQRNESGTRPRSFVTCPLSAILAIQSS